MSAESPEQLLDAFKAAALSVTKLYKTSAAAQAKSRADGYQDCLDELLAFLDKDGLGLAEGEGSRIRRWAMERVEGRDTPPGVDSDDDADKVDASSSPELQRETSTGQFSTLRNEDNMPEAAAPSATGGRMVSEDPEIVVPSQDVFTFQSSHPYPPETYMNLANLDLSDSRNHESSMRSNPNTTQTRNGRTRNGTRTGSRTSLGRGAGTKRKVNLAEIFDLGSLEKGNGRDMFGGNNSKRGRHA